jgi:hypothetical protein
MGWNVFARPSWLRGILIGFVLAAGVAACSSSPVDLKPMPTVSASASGAFLSAAIATGCIGASKGDQTAPLPAAGGVTGTVTVGPVALTGSGCALSVEVATGADASLQSSAVSARVRRAAAEASPLPSPIAQVDLSTTTSNASWLAVTFTMPTSVPAGSYPATITTTVDLGDGQTYTTTTNYTVTVAPNGTAALHGINVTLGQYSNGLLSIYPQGTILPAPSSPSPSPSASATAAPTATAPPTMAASATPTRTPTPSPTPTAVPTTAVDCLNVNAIVQCGNYVSNGSYDGPGGYYSPEPTPGVSSPQPLYNHTIQGDLEGTVYIPYYWFVGTVTVTLDNYAPGQQQMPTNDCPSTFTLTQSGIMGDTYTMAFPANGAQSALGDVGYCSIYIDVANEFDSGGAYVLNIGYPGGAIVPSMRRSGTGGRVR